jgi:hypothetical protein
MPADAQPSTARGSLQTHPLRPVAVIIVLMLAALGLALGIKGTPESLRLYSSILVVVASPLVIAAFVVLVAFLLLLWFRKARR